MGIYIDINGTWGPSDELIVLDDSLWSHDDYQTMSMWTQTQIGRYASTHGGLSPTEWENR